MGVSKKITPLKADKRYPNLIKTYSCDWSLLCTVLFGRIPSWQQDEVLDSVSKKSSRTSVASGHGTGKSDLSAMFIIIFMIMYPDARVVIVANKIQQVRDVIWKYLKTNHERMQKRVPWLAEYFIVTETEYYERTRKGIHFVSAKGFKPNQEESLAGEHADHMLTIIDEACGVNDKAFGVLLGAQTGYDNRVICLSQPLRQGGFFYDTHHSLSIQKNPNSEKGTWNSLVLNSMESPFVDRDWVKEHLIMYGGFDSPEFQIKVLGRFPEHMSDMLLGREEAQIATRAKPVLDDEWGWVALCDVGAGRDRSVINISKISGSIGRERKVISKRVKEQRADLKPLAFARAIIAEVATGEYPNITIVIDGGGVGLAVVEYLEMLIDEQELDIPIQVINWGDKCFSSGQQRRFINQRAMATIYCRDAIQNGRHRLDNNTKTVDQASKIPCYLNDSGQWVIEKKTIMRSKYQIPSPDRFDTHCFAHLASFIPHDEEMQYVVREDDEVNEFEDFLNE